MTVSPNSQYWTFCRYCGEAACNCPNCLPKHRADVCQECYIDQKQGYPQESD